MALLASFLHKGSSRSLRTNLAHYHWKKMIFWIPAKKLTNQ